MQAQVKVNGPVHWFMRARYLLHKGTINPLKRRDVDEDSGQIYGPVHESLAQVTNLSSECPGEHAHSCNTLEK